jgi:hypothetical protein
MADTAQAVSWALERPCELRANTRGWERPVETARQLHQVRAFADACGDGRVFNDVCITGISHFRGHELPTNGFRVGDALRAAGGIAGVRQICGGCEARWPRTRRRSAARQDARRRARRPADCRLPRVDVDPPVRRNA